MVPLTWFGRFISSSPFSFGLRNKFCLFETFLFEFKTDNLFIYVSWNQLNSHWSTYYICSVYRKFYTSLLCSFFIKRMSFFISLLFPFLFYLYFLSCVSYITVFVSVGNGNNFIFRFLIRSVIYWVVIKLFFKYPFCLSYDGVIFLCT